MSLSIEEIQALRDKSIDLPDPSLTEEERAIHGRARKTRRQIGESVVRYAAKNVKPGVDEAEQHVQDIELIYEQVVGTPLPEGDTLGDKLKAIRSEREHELECYIHAARALLQELN